MELDANQKGSMQVRLIGLDLDGTVLNKNKEMTENVAEAIEAALDSGIMVVPVTGRPLSGIPKSILNLKGIRYAITSNGAVTVDLEKNEICESHFLSEETILNAVKMAENENIIYDVFINGVGYSSKEAYEKQYRFFENTPLISYVKESRNVTDDILEFMNQKAIVDLSESERMKYSFTGAEIKNSHCGENIWMKCDTPEQCDRFEKALKELDPEANVIRMMSDDVEMVARDADKGDAFLHLAAANGIKTEETMAIGDSINDIGFMKKAGISVAMGNADEIIKEISDYYTDDCEHDGVATAIRRFCGL